MLVQVVVVGIDEAQVNAVDAHFGEVEAKGLVHRQEILAVVQHAPRQCGRRAWRVEQTGAGGQGEQQQQA
ncbi:hypothetical protein D3C77_816440 [compost metagenome]